MSSVNLEKASKLNIERNKKKKLYRRVVSVLAAIVVFCTTYALILPAITMNKKYSCGLEEHTHGDTCFTEYVTMTLTCSPSCHTHTEDCKDENGEYIMHGDKSRYIGVGAREKTKIYLTEIL